MVERMFDVDSSPADNERRSGDPSVIAVEDPPEDWPSDWGEEWPGEWPEDPGPQPPSRRQAIDWKSVPIELLGHVLWTADAAQLDNQAAVDLLAAQQRHINHLMAQRARMIVDVTDRSEGDPAVWGEFAGLEVGTALTLTRRAAEAEVELSYAVVHRLPDVWSALYAGEIDWARARTLVRGVEHIREDVAAQEVIAAVIADAPRLTTGQLAARIRRVCLERDPEDAHRRYEKSVEDRRVVTMPRNDGTGDLIAANLPPDRLNEAMQHVDGLARSLLDDRTIDQKRADVVLDLLSGRCLHLRTPAAAGPQITVDLETLIGLADRPGELAGWGPVVADIARQALEEDETGRLRIRVTDADAAVDVATRRPTAAQARGVRHRYPTCVFPGCRMPAGQADLDHTRRYADRGPTSTDNLAPLCRHHHRAKDEGGWSYRRDDGGSITWTSPLGLAYTVDPRGP